MYNRTIMRGSGKTWGIIALVILGIGVAGGTCFTLVHFNDANKKEETADVSQSEPEPEPEPEPVATDAKMKILLAGTTFWGRRTNQWARESKLGVKYPFSKLNTLHRENYDAWISGLECPLVQKENNYHNYGEENSIFKFNCDPDYLPARAIWASLLPMFLLWTVS